MVFEGFKRWRAKGVAQESETADPSKLSSTSNAIPKRDSKMSKIFKKKDPSVKVMGPSAPASPSQPSISLEANSSAISRDRPQLIGPKTAVPLPGALSTPRTQAPGPPSKLTGPNLSQAQTSQLPARQADALLPGLAKGVPSASGLPKQSSDVSSLIKQSHGISSPSALLRAPAAGGQLEKAKSVPAQQFQGILKQKSVDPATKTPPSQSPGVASTSGPIQTAARHVNPPALQQSSSPLSFNNRPSPPVLELGGEEVARKEAAEPQKPSSSPATRATDDVPSEHALKKRVAIAAENVQDANVSIPIIPKSSATLQLLEKATETNLLFEMLPKSARKAIFNSMAPSRVPAGTEIIKQGDEGTKFYILERGVCEVFVKKAEWGEEAKHVHTYHPGSAFGELALLYSAARAATVKASADCSLWVMDRAVYNTIKHNHTVQLAAEKRALVASAPMLSILSPENREIVAEALELEEYEPGDFIFHEGDLGDRFYLIKEGTVMLSTGPEGSLQVKDRRSDKAYFGERSLIKEHTRTVDAIAESWVACFTLKRAAFIKLLGPIEDVWKLEALRKVPILFNLPESQLKEMALRMKTMPVKKDQLIFQEGDEGDTFYVIEDGTFVVFNKSGAELARVGKGSCFGELALLNQARRAASVKALTNGHLLTLTRKNFDELLGSLADIRQMWRFEALGMVPILAILAPGQRSQLCAAMKQVRVQAGQAILNFGKPSSFYIIEAGTCSVCNQAGQEIAQLGPTMYMGEAALAGLDSSKLGVRAVTTVDLLTLQRSDAVRVLGPDFLQLVGQTTTTAKRQNLKMSDLTVVTRLGAGAFGLVSLVKEGASYYALKQMAKAQIVQMGLQEHVKREKLVMAECDCPFMVNLVASFKDNAHLYMLQEAIMGGELFTYLQSRQRPLSEEHARFYAASVVLGLEYMQQRNMMWRDLKPENLLIDTQGYVKMADFGFAKKMPVGQKSYTLCGTPEYLAPELVTQSGHNRAVDWWATGVLIYEMVAGTPPFSDEDRVTMFKNICHVRYNMPAYFSKELKDLVKRMLVLNPSQRLGFREGGAATVKQHPWFQTFDWQAFANRTMAAPHVPKVRHPEDASNFIPPPADAGKEHGGRYVSTGIFKDF